MDLGIIQSRRPVHCLVSNGLHCMSQFDRFAGWQPMLTLVSMSILASGGCAPGRANATLSDPIPAELSLIERDSCDAQNRRLYVENRHASRTFSVTVRWRAVGGKELTESVLVGPQQIWNSDVRRPQRSSRQPPPISRGPHWR